MKRIKATFETLNDVCVIIQVAFMICTTVVSSMDGILEQLARTV